MRQKKPLSSVSSQHNFCVYGILLELPYDKPTTITKSVRRVNVPKQYDRTINLQRHLTLVLYIEPVKILRLEFDSAYTVLNEAYCKTLVHWRVKYSSPFEAYICSVLLIWGVCCYHGVLLIKYSIYRTMHISSFMVYCTEESHEIAHGLQNE